MAALCLRVNKSCRGLGLGHGCKILLAVSGGSDSIALAAIFSLLAPKEGWELEALTVDHGLRMESCADALHAKQNCARIGIPCSIIEANVAKLAHERKCGLEEAGRHVRYEVLEQTRKRIGADFIALGHHSEDLAEDILMRITRGTGWPGLGGMPTLDRERCLVRPLLFEKKTDLRLLLNECSIEWREDASNADMTFMRNRVRKNIIPALRKENPSLGNTFSDLHEMAAIDSLFWHDFIKNELAKTPWHENGKALDFSLLLPSKLLSEMPQAARLRCYLLALKRIKQICHFSGQARAKTLLAADRAFSEKRGGKIFQLAGGLRIKISKEGATFYMSPNRK